MPSTTTNTGNSSCCAASTDNPLGKIKLMSICRILDTSLKRSDRPRASQFANPPSCKFGDEPERRGYERRFARRVE